MTKNITVIDEKGNITGSTYLKRAHGLVKKGRGQWIDSCTVMLTDNKCESEATDMAANIYEVFDNQVSKMQEQLREQSPEQSRDVHIQILKTMEAMRKADYADRALEAVNAQLNRLQDGMNAPCSKEHELEREITRQKMVELMELLLSPNAHIEHEETDSYAESIKSQYVFEDEK